MTKVEKAEKEYLEILDEIDEANNISKIEEGYWLCLMNRERCLFEAFNDLSRQK